MTNDIRLRNVEEGDLTAFFEHQMDPDANHMAAFPPRDRAAFMAHWTKILADESVVKKTILLDGPGKPVSRVAGNIVSFDQHGKRLIGYWIGKTYWGKGVATKALAEFLALVKARPLFAYVAKRNVASIRVLEKSGFTICGEGPGPPDATGEEVEELLLTLQ